MKQNKFSFILKFLIINFFISGLMSLSIFNLTTDRYEKNLGFKINLNTTPLQYIHRDFGFKVNDDPTNYIRELDKSLRNYSNNLSCSNLSKIRKTLPVSFALIDRKVSIKITSKSENEVNQCAKLIFESIDEYNMNVRKRFIQDYEFSTNMKRSRTFSKEAEEKIMLLNREVERLIKQDMTIENILDVLSILDLQGRLYLNNETVQKEKFIEVVNQINIITLENENFKLSKPPANYIIFISTFVIITFIYFIFTTFVANRKQIKRNFQRIFK